MEKTIRDWQEIANSFAAAVGEIKDDLEEIEKRGEYDPLMLFDLYQKIDDLGNGVDDLIRNMIVSESKS